ncbi:polysaccharide lyase, partial [Alphaproteobacteria bacterium]|nr:polysaccharide lyase [Alphaproteobacteria bacterium]
MNKVFGILLVGWVFSVLAVSETAWAAKNFKDDDWTHSFYERCSSRGGFANGSQVKWMKEGDAKFLRFTLADGQKGNCSRDKHRRKKGGAPHWERSEISSGTDTNSKFRLRSGGNYQIKLRVRFVEGFSSDKESILQIYSECQWKGRCSPLLQLRSIGSYPNPGYLRTEVLQKRGEKKKKRGNWNSASALDDYFQSRTYLTNDATGEKFSPITHKGKWVDIIFHVQVTPKTVTLMSQLEAHAGVWRVPIQTIDRPPGMLDPHIEIGLYRPGSDTFPNPTSTIDFDYIKITKGDKINFSRSNTNDDKVPSAQATTDPYQSYSDKQICTMVGA